MRFEPSAAPVGETAADEGPALAEMAVLIGFNTKKLSDEDLGSAVQAEGVDELPKPVFDSLERLLARLGGRLQVAFPGCFNPSWKKVTTFRTKLLPCPCTDHGHTHCRDW